MGQYYKPVNPEKGEHLESWSYNNGAKLMEHSWLTNDFVGAVEGLLIEGGRWHKQPLVWCGDYADDVEDVKDANGQVVNELYSNAGVEIKPPSKQTRKRYIVNHTKGLYVDKKKGIANEYGYTVHPLPILTCVGNGQGGGDLSYYTGDSKLIGAWCGDRLSIEGTIPDGFKEVIFNIIETR